MINRFVLESIPFVADSVEFCNIICSTLTGQLSEEKCNEMKVSDKIKATSEKLSGSEGHSASYVCFFHIDVEFSAYDC